MTESPVPLCECRSVEVVYTVGFYYYNINFHRCHWQSVCSLKLSRSHLSAWFNLVTWSETFLDDVFTVYSDSDIVWNGTFRKDSLSRCLDLSWPCISHPAVCYFPALCVSMHDALLEERKKKERSVSEISAEMTRKSFWRLIKIGLKVNTNLLKERLLNYYLARYIPSGLPKQHSIGLFHWATKASGFWPRLTLGRWVALNTVAL